MSERLLTRSVAFIEGNEYSDEIVIPQRLFTQWLDFFPHGQSMLATLEYQGIKRLVCIGSGHESNFIYCPQWILSHLGSTLTDESLVTLELYQETLPVAEKIVLKVLYREDETMDLRSAMETYLDRFHVLQAETTLQIADSTVCVWVEAVEPPGWVALGGEVILEFLEEPEPEPEPEPESSSITQPSSVLTEEQKEIIRQARIKRFAAL